ncbi:MFS transporter [Candidatus Pacearchaeota archaeon]|nr:MFS transporter [Candidatus Pacearchaeota archaeon]
MKKKEVFPEEDSKRTLQEDSIMQSSLKQKALNVSIKEGEASSFSGAVGETYITPFILALKADSLYVGIFSAISGLIAPLSQLFGDKLMEKHSRKKIVRAFILAQALIWICIVSLAYLLWQGVSGEVLVIYLLVFYVLFAAFGGIIHPTWFSWMGDLVPDKERGRYFSKRNRITGFLALIGALAGAFVLDIFETKGYASLGFLVLFSFALIFRFISFLYINKQYEPVFKLEKDYYFSIWSFLKRLDNYGKFAVFHAFFNFALMIASPFFAVYMLEELEFSYITFMIVTMSSSAFYLVFTPIVGKFSDKYGNRKLFIFGCILFGLNPLLWIFIKNPVALVFVPQVIVGLANAAFVLAVSNFTYDSANQQHRALCTTYTNILAGFGIFFGSLIGGYLLKYFPETIANSFVIVFALSAVLRLGVSIFFASKIHEVKKVKKLPPMHIKFIHPFKTLHAEIGWIKKVMKED